MYSGDNFELDLTLTEIIRGDEAWRLVYNAIKFNTLPESTSEIILAKFSATVTYASNKDIQYDLIEFDSNLYEGASNDGWVAFVVKKTDLKPLIVYGKAYDGTGGIWFRDISFIG